ncbi:class I SAM-dependent methyltransferase [Candidatus Kapaibacterium sp.]
MINSKLREKLESELSQEFSGWDFSYLKNRVEYSSLPWNYKEIIKRFFKNANTCLDMGTGGGEFLDSIKDLPPQTYATEGYKPNIELACNRLNKRNIVVKEVNNDEKLPFESDFFDLVINRHESYSVSEVLRILKPRSIFITQQVGGMNNIDLNARLGAPEPNYYNWNLFKAIDDLKNNGFEIIEYDENIGYQRFYDTGSIAYYLKCIPWQICDFTINKYFSRLKLIDEYIEKHQHIDFIAHRFYIIAKNK